MGLILNTSTVIRNLSIGPLSGGGDGGGGGGGGSTPTYMVLGGPGNNSVASALYVYDATNLFATPTKLVAHDPSNGNNYARENSVASTSDHISVGAFEDSTYGSRTGAVYVYDTSNLSAQATKLHAPGNVSNTWFGYDVKATGNYIGVTAPFNNSGQGAAFVYDATNLSTAPTQLGPGSLVSGDQFGRTSAIGGDYYVVSGFNSNAGNEYGAVYVYDLTNLSAGETKVVAPDGYAGHQFGRNGLAVSNKYLIVGTDSDDAGSSGNDAGAAYVYDMTNLSASPTKFTGTADNESFGTSAAIAGDYIIIGSLNKTNGRGTIYVYDGTNLSASPTAVLHSDVNDNEQFGANGAIAAMGTSLIIGHKSYDQGSTADSGAGYVYDLTNLSAAATRLLPSTPTQYQNVGKSVAIG
jgi:hypothetical protein